MFGLRVPLTKCLTSPEFDGVQAIFHNSGLREPNIWLSKVNSRGEIFHLEVDGKNHDISQDRDSSFTDRESLCVCSDCATDDTGYGTDTDISGRKDGENNSHHQTGRVISDFCEVEEFVNGWRGDNDDIDFRTVEENIDNLFASNSCKTNQEGLDFIENDSLDFIVPDDIESIFGCSIEKRLECDQNVTKKSKVKFDSDQCQNEISSCQSSSAVDPNQTACQCSAKRTRDSGDMDEQRLVVVRLKTHQGKNQCQNVVELCEQILGIVPGRFNSDKLKKRSRDGHRVKIRGLVPIGVSIKHPEVHVGDWLKSINGQTVSWENLETILHTLLHQKQAKLVLQRVPRQLDRSIVLLKKNQTISDRMVQLVTGSHDNTVSSISATELETEPFYSAMYLSLEGMSSETMLEKEDVLYQFPSTDNMMIKIRGMFQTIAGAVLDATESVVQSTRVVCEDTQVNVVYHKEGPNLFIVSVPQLRLSVSNLKLLVSDVMRVLQVMYGSVQQALSSANQKQLDCFFSLLHHSYISESKHIETIQSRGYSLSSSVQSLPLPNEIKMVVDRTLTDFEAADFGDMSDSFYGCRRNFSILGSCLFYKSYLLCHHLPADDLLDISLYLRYHALFSLTSDLSLGQLVLWREVFPTRHCHSVGEEQTFGYSEPVYGRWFWLIVGYKHLIFSVMLETGGCTAVQTGVSTPDPFLIDQAKVVLMQLDSHNLQSRCQPSHQEGPPTVNPDQFSLQKNKMDLLHKLLKKSTLKDSNNHVHVDNDGSHSLSLVRKMLVGRKLSFGSEGSSESGGSDPLFKASRRGRLFPEISDPYTNIHEEVSLLNTARKLTVGADNCLFHFQYFDNLEGVFISSNQEAPSSHMSKEVYENFHRCCQKIKSIFDMARYRKEQKKKRRDHVFGLNDVFTNIREEGVVFHVPSTDEKSLSLSYLVVGRSLSRSMRREVYVCFLDNTPQTAIELAFKLILGYLP